MVKKWDTSQAQRGQLKPDSLDHGRRWPIVGRRNDDTFGTRIDLFEVVLRHSEWRRYRLTKWASMFCRILRVITRDRSAST